MELRVHRLGQVVPRPGLDALLAVALHRLRGHGHDRQLLQRGILRISRIVSKPSISGIMMSISTMSTVGSSSRMRIASPAVVGRQDDHVVLFQDGGQGEDVPHVVVHDQHRLALQDLTRLVQVVSSLPLRRRQLRDLPVPVKYVLQVESTGPDGVGHPDRAGLREGVPGAVGPAAGRGGRRRSSGAGEVGGERVASASTSSLAADPSAEHDAIDRPLAAIRQRRRSGPGTVFTSTSSAETVSTISSARAGSGSTTSRLFVSRSDRLGRSGVEQAASSTSRRWTGFAVNPHAPDANARSRASSVETTQTGMCRVARRSSAVRGPATRRCPAGRCPAVIGRPACTRAVIA